MKLLPLVNVKMGTNFCPRRSYGNTLPHTQFRTTSAWYILATIGRYRLCPGKPEWTPCKRLVKSVKVMGKELL